MIESRPRDLIVSGVVILGIGLGVGWLFSPDPEPEVKIFTETETVTETVEVPAPYPEACLGIDDDLFAMRHQLIEMGHDTGGLGLLAGDMYVLNISLSERMDVSTQVKFQRARKEYTVKAERVADHGIQYLKMAQEMESLADNCAADLEDGS